MGLSFIPVLNKLIPFLPHFPKLVILVEFEGSTQQEIDVKIAEVEKKMEPFNVETQLAADKKHEEKFSDALAKEAGIGRSAMTQVGFIILFRRTCSLRQGESLG